MLICALPLLFVYSLKAPSLLFYLAIANIYYFIKHLIVMFIINPGSTRCQHWSYHSWLEWVTVLQALQWETGNTN